MSQTRPTDIVLRRFADKCRIAGGPKAGYMMRKDAIQYGLSAELKTATDGALNEMVEQGLLMPNDAADRYFLTESGVEALASSA